MAASSVDDYLAALSHAHLDGIRRLRAAILVAEPRLVEHIKWNAPSYGLGDDDILTMRLAPKDAFQLVFHRGVAKVEGSVAVDDPEGLLVWKGRDRAVLDLGTTARGRRARAAGRRTRAGLGRRRRLSCRMLREYAAMCN